MSTQSYWYNYQLQEHELRDAPSTDDEARALLPQIPVAQQLYGLLREHEGMDILLAMVHVLKLMCGETEAR